MHLLDTAPRKFRGHKIAMAPWNEFVWTQKLTGMLPLCSWPEAEEDAL